MSPVGVTDAEGVGSTLSTCGKGPLTLNGNRTLSPNACKRKHMLEESPTGKIPHCPVWFKIKAVKHLRVITRWALRMPCLSHSHIILQRMNPQGIHGFEIDILSGRYRFKGMHDCGLLLYAFQGRFFLVWEYILLHTSPQSWAKAAAKAAITFCSSGSTCMTLAQGWKVLIPSYTGVLVKFKKIES